MTSSHDRPRRVPLPWLVPLAWLGIGLLNYGQTYLGMVAGGERDEFEAGAILVYQLLVWAYWIPVTWLVLWLAGRRPMSWERGERWRTVALYGAVGLVVLVLNAVHQAVAVQLTFSETVPFAEFIRIFLSRALQFTVFIYLTIVALVAAYGYARRLRERERTADRLRTELARAELMALKMQLHPHFLFNTLQNVASLVRRDPDLAARTVTRLGDLLRLTLDHAGTQEVPLKEELAFLELYCEIERTRFPDRLRVTVDVPDALRRAAVPNMLLQPLVENALRHAVAPRAAGGTVAIAARRRNGDLVLSVADDGPGMPATGPAPGDDGIGLSNTRNRLAHLYGGDRLTLATSPSGGAEVRITIPYREWTG